MLLRYNIKRFFAGFLLALFVFIQAEKNFHEHQLTEKCDIRHDQSRFEKGSYCFICDFHLAADADLPLNSNETITARSEARNSAGLLTYCLQSPLFFFSGRGPPQAAFL